MTSAPSLSFIIPAYNAQATLPRTLASLRAQSRADWQAILVDDGSSDATAKLARAAASADPRISVHVIPHGGVSVARNCGLAKAQAEWLCFLDADDWVRRDFCRVMLDAVRPDLDLIYCGHERISPDGGSIPIFSPDFRDRGFECAARECPTAIHSIIVRRSLVERVKGFDPALTTCEDWDLWQKVSRAGARIASIPKFLAFYCMSDSSLSRGYRQVVADGHKVIRRGFSRDPRVEFTPEATANGAKGSDVEARCSFLTAWCAAAEAAAGGDGAALLQAYPADLTGHTAALGKCLALAFATGAKMSMASLATALPRLRSRYERLLEALGARHRQAAAQRGIGYALEREILRNLPGDKSTQLVHVAKMAVNLKTIYGFDPSPGVDVLLLEFFSGKELKGSLEVPIFGPLSRRDVAEYAMDFFGRGKFVKLSGLVWRPGYHLTKVLLCIWAAAVAGRTVWGKRLRRPFGLRSALREALRESALCVAADGDHALRHPPEEMCLGLEPLLESPQPTARPDLQMPRTIPEESPSRARHWDAVFSRPDPWDYGCDYEQTKYHRTLELVPAESLERVLELACAEGHFTEHLARRAHTLVAADISSLALERARERCKDVRNASFRLLDLIVDEIPGNQSLIVCSEVLYYIGRERLAPTAARLRDALAPSGRLVMAHAFLLKDDMTATGFDWDQDYGGKVIHEALLATEGLALEQSIVTELYRIDCFKKCDAQEAPLPVIRWMELDCRLEPSLTRQVVWGGAWDRRSDLVAHEKCWDIPVLAYHRIAADGPASLQRWRTHPDTFRKQLRLLRAHGFYSVTSADLQKAFESQTPLPGRPVLITFDDGYQDFADIAWPILEAEGFNAEVFIVTSRVGGEACWDVSEGEAAPLMDWPTIAALHQRGVQFGSHLATHTPATNLSSRDLLEEVVGSRAELEIHLRSPILSVAAPFGAVDERFNRILATAGYRIGFAGEGRRADIRHDRYGMRRLEMRGDWSIDDFARAMELSRGMPGESRHETLVTVVIPAYNAAHTIDETLRSARGQTHRNLEILVVDDGSHDETPAIVSRHAAKDDRVRLITQRNAGVAAARNRGISEARSDLIATLDADDLWSPSKIEKQVQALMRGGEKVALVYTWFAVIDERGHVNDLEHRPLDAGQVLKRMCGGNLVGNGSSPLLRKSAVLEAGGFESGLRAAHAQGCEDLLLYFRIS
ncbi:MAG TPA: glycosyltransferase, partial [Rhizomicrobium sp.]|nr:glycosyltransferase [Rhizomicrobium sp.]